ncbi:lysophospholipid acyltransferase family protein [Botrimarina sp.]|uniref:lysophospholipid acyltransferase family protein n=1 Tax=Botrimarina sp. TaxID=2795802 RepID=UPI0032EEAAE0
MPRPPHAAPKPRVSRRVLACFRWYTRRYLRRAFHSVAIARPGPEPPRDGPLVVYLNHASWWDPLVAMRLAEVVAPDRTLYAPFDAEALQRYPVFEKLGFFPVQQGTRRGAAQFLSVAREVLEEPRASLWVTPEGGFVDPRDRAARLEPGLAHLADRLAAEGRDAWLWPLAIEYPFWEERLPEALCQFGEPIAVSSFEGLGKAGWNTLLADRLRDTQRALEARSLRRNPSEWRVVLGGAEGVGGVYESVRWLKAKLTGRSYRAAHGEKLSRGPTTTN